VTESVDPLARCEVHEQQNCGICRPPAPSYRRGDGDWPAGTFVSIRHGKGVYHHPDCYNVTGDWDGGDTAKRGERLPHTAEQLRDSDLRPAECCQPPLFPR
jgi:hypothetical protein